MSAPDDVPLTVLGVRVDLPAQNHALLLLTPAGDRVVPVWVGAAEATAVALVLDDVPPPRPLTHDLLLSAVRALGGTVSCARFSGTEGETVLGELVLADGTVLDARPSDAVAVALRAEAPVLAPPAVVEELGVPAQEHDTDDLESFRRFLDDVDPEDFA
ncbi:bifunctional nuclease family protein [Micrococcus lylae]|uniref:bifunctional nuclease family protein n=1 Tax=Micrococcus lylae TaxID=1273 RepID=UPI0021A81C5F|nr:bifunctional nuclease family protein [Micrococcus lylae]MCT2007364.1 bifunctional nuclease family protein [Micrococcus lylae]MCT2071209.1 bifunctional nuclease family protein [Micrococcus lylae]